MLFKLVARSLVGVLLTVATATIASAQLPRVIPPSIASPKSPPPRFVPGPKTTPKGSIRTPAGTLPKNWFSGTPKSAYKLPVTPRLRGSGVNGPSRSKGNPVELFPMSSDGKGKPPADPPGPIQPIKPVGPIRPIGG